MTQEIDMEQLVRKTYRHGNVPNAMRAAARAILDDEDGGNAVGLREAARRIGVSPTAAYRHFANKEDLLASVAAEGFQELSASLDTAMRGPDRLLGLGLAYVEFALQKRGLFRLMFGPILAERAKYPRLKQAAADAFRTLQVAQAVDGSPGDDEQDGMAAWGLLHGLSSLFIDGFVPEDRIPSLAQKIIMMTVVAKPAVPPAAIAM
jgi:AcrR family transcriptional regulator